MVIEWDPRKAATNLRKHGVSFHEAGSVLGDPLSTTYPDPEHSLEELRYITVGASATGRILVVAHPTGQTLSGESARGGQPRSSAGSMKKAANRRGDDLRPEYDFSSLSGGVRGKYAERFRASVFHESEEQARRVSP